MQRLVDLSTSIGFRKAAANFGWLFAERGSRFALGAIVGLLVARYLGPAQLGTLSYCMALVTLLSFVPGLGLDVVIKRELLRTPEKAPELLASSFLLHIAAGL